MAINHSTEGFVFLDGVTFTGAPGSPGSTLSWASTSTNVNSDNNYLITDVDEDGRLDAGIDYFTGSSFVFSGYTYSSGGIEYPIFANGPIYMVPLPQDGTTQTLIPGSDTTNAYQSETGNTNVYLCFAPGTLIATPQGERAVETLSIGDLVTTADNRDVPVKWLGRQAVRTRFPDPKLEPVRISSGALGNGLPHSDLTVSADHGMILDNLVINASALVNGTTIRFVPLAEMPPDFTYWHVETEAHDVILANGAPSETFLDAAGREAFDNHAEYLALYGTERIIPELRLPRIASQRLLPEAIKARLGIETAMPELLIA